MFFRVGDIGNAVPKESEYTEWFTKAGGWRSGGLFTLWTVVRFRAGVHL